MRLACADDTFRLLRPHHAVLELIAAIGVDGVDVFQCGNRSIVRPDDVRDDIDAAVATIAGGVRAAGLAISDVFVIPWSELETLAPNRPEPEQRSASRGLLCDMVEFAGRLESPGITIVPGSEWPGERYDESLARTSDELTWRCDNLAETIILRDRLLAALAGESWSYP